MKSPTPRSPRRDFTPEDLHFQRQLLLHGARWEVQYEVPRRPWSPESERRMEAIQQDLDVEDWYTDRERADRFSR